MTIYDIDSRIAQIIDEAIDPETGEINEEAYTELEQLQMDRQTKCENIACLYKAANAEAAAIKAEKMKLAERQAQAEKRTESIKKYLLYALNGEKLKTARCSVSYRKSEAVEIKDEQAVIDYCLTLPDPYKYMKVETSVKKDGIKDYIKENGPIAGAELVERVSVIVK